MPITVTQGPPIPNAANCNNAQRSDAQNAIRAVPLGGVWRSRTTIADFPAVRPTVRVDNQANIGTRANLQVQLNGVPAPSTIAHVLVDASVGITGGPAAAAQQLYAIRQIQGALMSSLSTGCTFVVTGTPT